MRRLRTVDRQLWYISLSLLSLLGVALFFATAKGLAARLIAPTTETYVEIDGVGYGVFSDINHLEDLLDSKDKTREPAFTRVHLRRDFVTDPSLSLWAKEASHVGASLKDIRLTVKTKDGYEVARYVLKYCKPLSWTMESADPSQGGFHEKIELAVQEIAIY